MGWTGRGGREGGGSCCWGPDGLCPSNTRALPTSCNVPHLPYALLFPWNACRYEGSRDALMAACEGVAKLGTMLLVLLGVLTYPGAWKEFSARCDALHAHHLRAPCLCMAEKPRCRLLIAGAHMCACMGWNWQTEARWPLFVAWMCACDVRLPFFLSVRHALAMYEGGHGTHVELRQPFSNNGMQVHGCYHALPHEAAGGAGACLHVLA